MGDHAPKLHGGPKPEPPRKRTAAKRKKPEPTVEPAAEPASEEAQTDATPGPSPEHAET